MNHPDIIEVGYWCDIWSPDTQYAADMAHYPDPRELVRDERPWDPEFKAKVVAYLRSDEHDRVSFRGSSRCRICEEYGNGHEDVSDGTYRWPSGLAHYIEAHEVDLPAMFVTHIIAMTEG